MTVSSYQVFMSFVDEQGDSSKILSTECYDKWVATRKGKLKQPEESYRRVLTAHICGLIGRKPFPPKVETSLLKHLRRRAIWECFKGTDVSIGIKGFRKSGFHESRRGIFGKTEPTPCLLTLGKRGSGDLYDTSYMDASKAPATKKTVLTDFQTPFGMNSQLGDLSWMTTNKYSNPSTVYNSFNVSAPLKVPSTPKTASAAYGKQFSDSSKAQAAPAAATKHSNVLSPWPSFVQ